MGRLEFTAAEELCYVLAVTTCGADEVSKEPTVQHKFNLATTELSAKPEAVPFASQYYDPNTPDNCSNTLVIWA